VRRGLSAGSFKESHEDFREDSEDNREAKGDGMIANCDENGEEEEKEEAEEEEEEEEGGVVNDCSWRVDSERAGVAKDGGVKKEVAAGGSVGWARDRFARERRADISTLTITTSIHSNRLDLLWSFHQNDLRSSEKRRAIPLHFLQNSLFSPLSQLEVLRNPLRQSNQSLTSSIQHINVLYSSFLFIFIIFIFFLSCWSLDSFFVSRALLSFDSREASVSVTDFRPMLVACHCFFLSSLVVSNPTSNSNNSVLR